MRCRRSSSTLRFVQRLTVAKCSRFEARALDRGLPHLSRLTLTNTGLSQRCLEAVGRLRGLRGLALEVATMADPGRLDVGAITGLAGLSRLELRLFASKVWQTLPAGFLLLLPAIWGGLEVLSLRGFGLGVLGFRYAGPLPKLRALDLSCCGFVDLARFVASLGHHHIDSLACLQLSGNKLHGLASIGALTSLDSLVLQSTRVEATGVAALLCLPRLKNLDVSDCGWLTEAGLDTLRGLSTGVGSIHRRQEHVLA
jgi:hypothetical protein